MKKITILSLSVLLIPAVCVFSAQGTPSLVLFDAKKDINDVQIQPVTANITFTDAHTVLVQTEPNKENPGVILKPKSGEWDLSLYSEVSMELKNAGTEPVRLYLRLDSSNADIGQQRFFTVIRYPFITIGPCIIFLAIGFILGLCG